MQPRSYQPPRVAMPYSTGGVTGSYPGTGGATGPHPAPVGVTGSYPGTGAYAGGHSGGWQSRMPAPNTAAGTAYPHGGAQHPAHPYHPQQGYAYSAAGSQGQTYGRSVYAAPPAHGYAAYGASYGGGYGRGMTAGAGGWVPGAPPATSTRPYPHHPPATTSTTRSAAAVPSAPATIPPCENCDKTFRRQHDRDAHMRAHRPCAYEGCSFEGTSRVLKDHVEVVHVLPTKYRPPSLETPEQVAKYLADRRKNFPTRANIARKKALEAAAKEKGVVPMGGATGKRGKKRAAPGDSDSAVKLARTTDATDVESGKQQRACRFYQRGHCRWGDKCRYAHVKKDPASARTGKNKNKDRNKSRKDKAPPKPGLNDAPAESLLKRLLAKEIHGDLSLILQSIRFFVEEDFFSSP